MKTRRVINILLALALVVGPLAVFARPVSADPIYTCLPTCESNDSRMLAIAGASLNTLVGIEISLEVAAPPDATAVEIGIFDGDTGGTWDVGTEPMEYTLFADPNATGATTTQVNQWMGNTMPDNNWFTVSVPTGANARSASGNYFYNLRVRSLNANVLFGSMFKVRTDGVLSLRPRPFAYWASIANALNIVYPNYPDLSTTTYDGQFDFHTYLSNSITTFELWDGDVDFGSTDRVDSDTDDPNTPNDTLPPFAILTARLEGVAVGANGATGSPNDDNLVIPSYRRAPSVFYEVAPLNQIRYRNANPSGNTEWEKFSISSDASQSPDHLVTGRLPAGLYHVAMEGLDLANLNAWRFKHQVIGVCPLDPQTGEANPCKDLLQPKMIGDTVFADTNRNGQQGANEAGIPGVVVQLFDAYGVPLLDINNNPITAITDANGKYSFDVEPRTLDEYTNEVVVEGTYTVVVLDSNFAAGGPLNGLSSTTGGNSLTRTVIDANVLTYDYGYARGKVPPVKPCANTYPYWSSHPDQWPVESLTIGGVTYTKTELITILNSRVKGDKSLTLFKETVAAMLNAYGCGTLTCFQADITAANQWLVENPVGSGVSGKSDAWKAILSIYVRLSQANNGKLTCPPPTN